MATTDPASAAALVSAVKRTRRRREKADADFRAAVIAARDAGVSLGSIADASGISRQRVWQIERGI